MPSKFQRNALNSLHSLGHPSIRATQKLFTVRYVRPDVNEDIYQWHNHALKCQKSIATQLHTEHIPHS